MTTVSTPRSYAHNSFASHAVVPPAATWNGGDSRFTASHTRVVQGRALLPQGVTSTRRSASPRRFALGQLAMGAVLGLTAVIGMLAVDPADDVVTPATGTTHFASMNVK
ncbi:hypothetical protein HW450_01565 [Corynebacterium hindlerae]|uniref:Uncharacterized protein n=1 Tax=Corynebacterium hindlerae TaxID=699041 RepID=A0A7G5FFS6_9CORY|nr:hypothetical protein [Corynebacterium hindlerae]QMV85467.1 hypothetical protein HW450_01565 [Corynebacterium hindlerae]